MWVANNGLWQDPAHEFIRAQYAKQSSLHPNLQQQLTTATTNNNAIISTCSVNFFKTFTTRLYNTSNQTNSNLFHIHDLINMLNKIESYFSSRAEYPLKV